MEFNLSFGGMYMKPGNYGQVKTSEKQKQQEHQQQKQKQPFGGGTGGAGKSSSVPEWERKDK